MNRKTILIAIGILVLVAAYFSTRILTGEADEESDESPYTAVPVKVVKVKNQNIALFITLGGRLRPEENVEVFAEVSGILERTSPPFREGNIFQRGQVLIHIDDRETRQNLIAQRSEFISAVTQLLPDLRLDFPGSYDQWLQYVEQFDPEEDLADLPEPKGSQEKYFITGRNIYTQYHNIRQMEIRLDKYRIRAPFTGSVTASNIDVGTLVREGQALGQFAKLHAYELVANTRIEDLQFIRVGDQVSLQARAASGEWLGDIVRISGVVDPATQMVNVFIRLDGEDLKGGMYLSGEVTAGEVAEGFMLHRDVLLETNEVFVIQDSIARLQAVELIQVMQDSVVVKGLEDNTAVINESRNPNFEGTTVKPEAENNSQE